MAKSFMTRDSGTGGTAYIEAEVAALALPVASTSDVWLSVKSAGYGAKGDGTTDDTTAIQNAINALANAAGGTVYFPPGTYRVNGQLTCPNTGVGSYPPQRAIRLTGAGTFAAGQTTPQYGGAILDMRATTAPGKIWTRGLGLLEIDHLILIDEGGDANPFIYTTGTTLHVHDCAFFGYSAKSQTTCDQDAIVLGGDTIVSDGSASAPFQGYISRIHDNTFSRIRRGVFLRVYCNGTSVRDNWFLHNCGSNLAGGCAIEVQGHSTNSCAGNVIEGNQIEMLGYVYGIKSDYAVQNAFLANSFYDPGNGTSGQAASAAHYRMEANALLNVVLAGFGQDTQATLSETGASVGTNLLLSSHSGQASIFPATVQAQQLKVKGGASQPTFQIDGQGGVNGVVAFTTNGVNFMNAWSNIAGAQAGGGITLGGGADNSAILVCDSVNANANAKVIVARAKNTQAVNIVEVQDSASNVLGGFNKNAYLFVSKNAAPADAELSASQMMLWFDSTNGAAKLMVKAKQADGTVRTGSLALA